jgi:hypothetical protein
MRRECLKSMLESALECSLSQPSRPWHQLADAQDWTLTWAVRHLRGCRHRNPLQFGKRRREKVFQEGDEQAAAPVATVSSFCASLRFSARAYASPSSAIALGLSDNATAFFNSATASLYFPLSTSGEVEKPVVSVLPTGIRGYFGVLSASLRVHFVTPLGTRTYKRGEQRRLGFRTRSGTRGGSLDHYDAVLQTRGALESATEPAADSLLGWTCGRSWICDGGGAAGAAGVPPQAVGVRWTRPTEARLK